MTNICYTIKEVPMEKEKEFNLEELLLLMNDDHDYDHYMNYNVKSLLYILDYYKINKKKLVKDEMVQLIVLFEQEYTNKDLVDQRKRLWNNICELKNNYFFKKFILFNV